MAPSSVTRLPRKTAVVIGLSATMPKNQTVSDSSNRKTQPGICSTDRKCATWSAGTRAAASVPMKPAADSATASL